MRPRRQGEIPPHRPADPRACRPPRGRGLRNLVRSLTLRRRLGRSSFLRAAWIVRARPLPQLECDWNRINIEPAPPRDLVPRAMKLPVVDPADRDDELVAYATSECAGLCEGEVMGVRGHAAADEAGLPQHESSMVFIPQANRLAQGLE